MIEKNKKGIFIDIIGGNAFNKYHYGTNKCGTGALR